MEPPPIVDFPKVVEPHLDGGKLVSYTSRYLTKPGDNYGSLMLAITANVKRPTGDIEELHLVAKLPPLFNDMYWQFFQPERTCVTENAIYANLAPEVRQLQLEAGVPHDELFNLVPIYYGSRISLNPSSTKVDRDAILVQENLQPSGYRVASRLKMFDFPHTKLVLEKMAIFHALPIALRRKKPNVFDAKIRPYFGRFNMNKAMGDEVANQLFQDTLNDVRSVTIDNTQLYDKINGLFEKHNEFLNTPNAEDTPYTTIEHSDLWINNMMMLYDENGNPVKLKIVDFQLSQYESLARDVIFFLFSSVSSSIVEHRFDECLRIYHAAFVRSLQSVAVNTDEYTFESFVAEVRRVAPVELPHAITMMKVILIDNSALPDDFKDMSPEMFSKKKEGGPVVQRTAEIIRIAQKHNFL